MEILEYAASFLIMFSGLTHLYLLDIQMKEAMAFCIGVGQATNILMGITMQMQFKFILGFSTLGVMLVILNFEIQKQQDVTFKYYAYPVLVLFNMIVVFKSYQDNLASTVAE